MANEEETIDIDLVTNAVNFYGTTLLQGLASKQTGSSANLCQKLLQRNLDFSSLSGNSKARDSLEAEIKSKISKLIVSNVEQLFEVKKQPTSIDGCNDSEVISDMPTFESFLDNLSSRQERGKFFHDIKPGNTVCCRVRGCDQSGVVVKLICVVSPFRRDLDALNIQVFIPIDEITSHDQMPSFPEGCLLRVMVKAVSTEPELLTLSLLTDSNLSVILGFVNDDDLPSYYRVNESKRKLDSYDHCLRYSSGFKNPTVDSLLCKQLCLPIAGHSSFLNSMKCANFAPQEFATALRKEQTHKLAMKSVVKGVEQFRSGHITEAVQYLNKALQVEPENVEGLVARGALYANSESYKLAVADFEAALKIDMDHKNAKRYLLETLLTEAKLHESSSKTTSKARKCYEKILHWEPEHLEAKEKLEQMLKKTGKKLRKSSPKQAEQTYSPNSSVISLSPVRSPNVKPSTSQDVSNESINGNEKSGEALESRLRQYYEKYSMSESSSFDDVQSKLSDSGLLDRLKDYYDNFKMTSSKEQKEASNRRRSKHKRRSGSSVSSSSSVEVLEKRSKPHIEVVEKQPKPRRRETKERTPPRKSIPASSSQSTQKRPVKKIENVNDTEIEKKKLKVKMEEEKVINKGLRKMEDFILTLKKKKDK